MEPSGFMGMWPDAEPARVVGAYISRVVGKPVGGGGDSSVVRAPDS